MPEPKDITPWGSKMIEVEREEKPVEPLPKESSPKFRWHIRGKPQIRGVSREPLLDACRVLKSLGELPDEQIAVFRSKRLEWDLKTTIGHGSTKTVRETRKLSPHFVPYRAFWQQKEIILCQDCGMNVTPYDDQNEPIDGTWEWYMVHDEVWQEAKAPSDGYPKGCLCIGCLEDRLGRKLTRRDFTDYSINELGSWDTPRLSDRKQRQ